jgi:hypothetical protein
MWWFNFWFSHKKVASCPHVYTRDRTARNPFVIVDRSGIGLSGYRLTTVCTENFTWCDAAGVYRGDSRLTSKNWWDNHRNYTVLESCPPQSARCTLMAVLRHQLLVFLTTFMLNVSFLGPMVFWLPASSWVEVVVHQKRQKKSGAEKFASAFSNAYYYRIFTVYCDAEGGAGNL